jgi:hypothetical protein
VLALGIVPSQALATSQAAQVRALRSAKILDSPRGQLVAYISGGRLFVKPIDGGVARELRTPWPVKTLQWSPDGSRIAFEDTAGQMAVVDLRTGDAQVLTGARLFDEGYYFDSVEEAWSPDGEFLAFPKEMTSSDTAGLWIWDRRTGQARKVASDMALTYAVRTLVWSHDSSRLAVAMGNAHAIAGDRAQDPELDVLTPARGTLMQIASGANASWSPDDRFLAYAKYDGCDNHGCYGKRAVVPAEGGQAVVFDAGIRSNNDNNQWSSVPGGYVFDRWLLDGAGRLVRTIVPPEFWAVGWAANGRYVLTEGFPPDAVPLNLVSLRGAARTIYTTASSHSCDVTSLAGYHPYSIDWEDDGGGFAFADLCKPNSFIYTISSTSGSELLKPVYLSGYPVAFVDSDQSLILQQIAPVYPPSMSLYLYNLHSHGVLVIVNGISSFALQPAIAKAPAPTLTPNQQHLAKAIAAYKSGLDSAFDQVDGTATDLGREGQFFRDEVTSDQFKVYTSIAQAAVDTLVNGWDKLGGGDTANTAAKLLAVGTDFGLGFAKDATIEAMSQKLTTFLADHSLTDQATLITSGIDKSLRSTLDKHLDQLIADPPNLSNTDTDAAISALEAREGALGWIGTRQVAGAAAILHVAFYQQGGSHVVSDLVTALWQEAAPLLASVALGPEAGVAATALIGVWNTAVAQYKLTEDAQTVAEYQLALLSMQSYAARLHDSATIAIAGLTAKPPAAGPLASATLANLRIVDSGAPATHTHRSNTLRELLTFTVQNTGPTMPFHVLVTYNTGFDINGKLTLTGQQTLHLSALVTLDTFQVAGKGKPASRFTLKGKATTSAAFTLLDPGEHVDLAPGRGEQLHIVLLAEPKPGDFVLVDRKDIPNDRALHFQQQEPISAPSGSRPGHTAKQATSLTVTLRADRVEAPSGGTVTLTAVANRDIAKTGAALEIVNLTTGTTAKRCFSGPVCAVSTAVALSNTVQTCVGKCSGQPPPPAMVRYVYVARIGALAQSNPVTITWHQ